MLSKILHINRNFISISIIAFFLLLLGALNPIVYLSVNGLLSFSFVLFSIVIFVVVMNVTKYYPNNYFVFFAMIYFFGFYNFNMTINFYSAFLVLYIVQSQLILQVRYQKGILNSFDTGFFSGFMSIFYLPYIIYILPMWFYYLILGKTEIRKFLLNVIGFVVFVILFFEIVGVFDLENYLVVILKTFDFNFIKIQLNYLFLLPIFVVLLIGFIDYLQNLNRYVSHKKIIFLNAIAYSLSTVIYIVLWGGGESENLLLLTFPIALFLTNLVNYTKNIYRREIYIWVVILSILLYKFSDYLTIPDLFYKITF